MKYLGLLFSILLLFGCEKRPAGIAKEKVKSVLKEASACMETCEEARISCIRNAADQLSAELAECPQGNVDVFMECANRKLDAFRNAVEECNSSAANCNRNCQAKLNALLDEGKSTD